MLDAEFKEKLKNAIKEERNVKESTLNAYVFNLSKLSKMIHGDEIVKSLDFLKDKKKVEEVLDEKKLSTRKTYYAAIIVGIMAMDHKFDKDLLTEYRNEMEEMADVHNKEMKEQKLSSTQEDNWTTLEKLREVVKGYKTELTAKGVFRKENKDDLTKKEMELLQKWVVGSLYVAEDDNPPLRLEYGDMKVISWADYNKMEQSEREKDNYLVVRSRNNKAFSLGDYKTKGKYGIKIIPVGKKLNSVLNVWLKYHDGKEGLLLNGKGGIMTRNGLTKFLNKVFEPTGKKNISASMLRHIYLTEKFPAINDEREEVADKMGHSVAQQVEYSKKVEKI